MITRKSFPVRLECGQTPFLHVDADGASLEYVTIASERKESGEYELVLRLRLKCDHPGHEVPHG